MTGAGIFVGWYDADPAFQPELDRWHSTEHMPERVALPGFLTGQRYAAISDPNHFCVLYRVEEVGVFISPRYLEILNNPTPWTRRMMPGVHNLNRTLCSVAWDAGAGFGCSLLTVQLSPDGTSGELENWLHEEVSVALATEPGVIRATLAIADQTISGVGSNEKALRGQPDAISDWVMLVEGYDATKIGAIGTDGLLSASSIAARGGRPGAVAKVFQLAHLLLASETR